MGCKKLRGGILLVGLGCYLGIDLFVVVVVVVVEGEVRGSCSPGGVGIAVVMDTW